MNTALELLGWGAGLEAALLLGCVLYAKLGPQVDAQGPLMGCAMLMGGTVLNVVGTPLVWFLSSHLGWH